MAKDNIRTFSIYLIKKGFEIGSEPVADGQCINLDMMDDETSVTIDGEKIGRLFVRRSKFSPPKWARSFDGAVPLSVFGTGGNPSAVLICAANDREYAITFGQGRYLLNSDALEEHFGLRAALNVIDVKALRSLDKRSFDTISRQSREQASKEVDVKDFGIDIEQDLLRSITGAPKDSAFGARVSGMDALKVSVRVELAGLVRLLPQYYAAFGGTDYTEHFSWIDHLSEVRDPEEKRSLDAELVSNINSSQLDRCWLAAPDIIDWGLVAGFKYQQVGDKQLHHDISWESLLPNLGGVEITLDLLKSRHVICLDGNDITIGRWSVYKCIYGEIERGNKTFLLSNGRWYRVDNDFAQQVNDFYNNIVRSEMNFPDYDHKGEGDYNIAVAGQNADTCALMDRRLVGRIEFCDLYFGGKTLVHVKRYGASSSLSHLFAQGLISGQLFASDADFRERLNSQLPEGHKLKNPTDKIATGEYEIVFAVISDQAGDGLTLPFFSRINLRHAIRTLEGYGYKVSLLKIPVKR